MDNLRGKIALLKIAQQNQDWFKPEEYAQLPGLLEKTEAELKQAEGDYEKIKTQYAQENVKKLIREAMATKEGMPSKK